MAARIRRNWIAVALGAALLASAAGCQRKDPPDPTPRVQIRGRTWRVELALTAEQHYRGLSGRQGLADDAGMLFVYGRPEVLRFCMRDCRIPLDIAFVDATGRIVKIHTMQVEPDRAGQKTYSSDQPVRFALEVAGGALAKAGVRVGDQVRFLGEIPW